jgi:2'-5' RNA ligase
MERSGIRGQRRIPGFRCAPSRLLAVWIGFEPENRKFSPHVTLTRLQQTPAFKGGNYLEANSLYASAALREHRFLLFFSVLGRAMGPLPPWSRRIG